MPDEIEIIETILRAADRLPSGYSKIGDDVAVTPVSGRHLVLKTDMLVERTDVPRGMTYRQAARKAVAMCVSDFAAKGVRPDSYMISLGVSRKTNSRQVDELALGFRDASRLWGVRLLGGDTSEADQLIIDCIMVGFAERVVPRDGARPGDVVVTTTPFGYPPAGLKILLGAAKATGAFRKVALRSVFVPSPNLRLGLALAGFWTATMDSSDGLARCLHTMSRMSGVGMEIETLPAGTGVGRFAETNRLSTNDLVLAGGEEYAIVGTLRPGKLRTAQKVAKANGGEVIEMGRVTSRPGRVVLRSPGGAEPIEDRGWVHLR